MKLKIGILFTMVTLMSSCQKELTKEYALEQLILLPEFNTPFYAPFGIGKELLNGDYHSDPNLYINEHLGKLYLEGWVNAKVTDRNSWRSILELTLTQKGKQMSDPSRQTSKSVHVIACKPVPSEITGVEVIEVGEKYKVNFNFIETDVTPFGEHLGFEEGKLHPDYRVFVRKRSNWQIIVE